MPRHKNPSWRMQAAPCVAERAPVSGASAAMMRTSASSSTARPTPKAKMAARCSSARRAHSTAASVAWCVSTRPSVRSTATRRAAAAHAGVENAVAAWLQGARGRKHAGARRQAHRATCVRYDMQSAARAAHVRAPLRARIGSCGVAAACRAAPQRRAEVGAAVQARDARDGRRKGTRVDISTERCNLHLRPHVVAELHHAQLHAPGCMHEARGA